MKNLKIFIICFLFFFFHSKGQEKNMICGTTTPENLIELHNKNIEDYNYYINDYYIKRSLKTSTALNDIPVKVHIVTDSDGNTSITEEEIYSEIEEANGYLANSFLRLFICDEINYIANDLFYNFDIDDQGLLYENHQENILNLYYVESITSGDSGICGYTYYPVNQSQYYDVIVMDNQCNSNPDYDTLAHEFGHHFFLIHTHGQSNSELTDELVTGQNCTTAGDLICDTPADPQLNSSNTSNVNCLYSGDATDEYGFLFEPDTSNIMSYAPQICRDNFTEGQYARMYAAFHTYKTYYECPSFNVDFSYETENDLCNEQMTVNFSDLSIGATSWEWDVDGDDLIDYYEQNPTHTYTQPGTYDVSLKISNASQDITKVYPNQIEINQSIFETTQINLKLLIVDVDENIWELKNSNDEIIYEGGPYSERGEYIHEMNVEQSECYTFTIYDSAGNGLEAYWWTVGTEYYELTTDNQELIYTNQSFSLEDSVIVSTNYLNTSDIIPNQKIKLIPNPADDFIEIKYGSIIPDYIQVFDLKGRLLFDKKINSESDLKLDVKKFNSGMYFMSVKTKQETSNLKFLVN